jgi:hypothetical protein
MRMDFQAAQNRAEEMLKDFAAEHAPGMDCDFFVKSDQYTEKGIIDFAVSWGAYFDHASGPDWKERQAILKAFEEDLKK